MAIENRETPIQYGAVKLTGIRELGFEKYGSLVVSGWTTEAVPGEPRGTFFATVPISSQYYRKRHRTKAAYERGAPDSIIIHDDWGISFTIRAPESIIDELIQDCIAHDIPQKEK